MRILHISTRLILGGSQENTIISCEGQARRGHEVHLAFGPIHGPEGSLLERVDRFRTPDGSRITPHLVPHLVREVNPLADLRCYVELKRLIRTLRPDVVHTHSSKAGILGRAAAWAVAGRARRAGRTPAHAALAIVHTIHGPPFMPVEGPPLKRLKTRAGNSIYTLAERFAARRCNGLVSVADAMTRQFLARRIGRPEQFTTVWSGMEIEPFLAPGPGESRAEVRARLGLVADDFVIGTIARLAEHKGHDDLLDALAADLRAHHDWKLLWVGDGWWRERLVARARGLGLAVRELDREQARPTGDSRRAPDATLPSHPLTASPSQVLVTGMVPPGSIPGLTRAMDVLAHPSYREGLPRTVPQALLAGVCPVAYDVDGTAEVCRNRQTGLLVQPGDRKALGEAIRWLADHPADRAAMAAKGREDCRLRFDAARMVEALELVYARAVRRATE